MDFDKITLYKKDNKGAIREWSIEAYDDDIIIEHGMLGGEMQEVFTSVDEGKAGRTIDEQIQLQINSKIKSQIDKGYVYSLEDARNNPVTNAIGLKQAMTAKKWKTIKNPQSIDEYHAQYKYNGHRCMVHNDGDEIIAYTRKGIRTTAIKEIIAAYEKSLPVDETVDGELYCHGVSLQKISSWAKKRQEGTLLLKHVAYDMFGDDKYSSRAERLKKVVRDADSSFILQAPKVEFGNRTVKELLDHVIDDLKYEGLILRRDGFPYENGKQSQSLIKVKRFMDGEFVVIDVIPSKDGWGILVMMADNGLKFHASCPGNVQFKMQVLRNKEKYKGATVNVEFAEYTDAGIPAQPIATAFVNRQFD
jgi:DNA ligase-1